MSNTEKFAALINRDVAALKTGSLRFWGLWFGRPYDNICRVVAAEAQSNLLRVRFDEAELLTVWSPTDLEIGPSVFRIPDAERVRWEWYSYGNPHVSENLYFEDYPKGMRGTSNVDWYTPQLDPLPGHPAVEML